MSKFELGSPSLRFLGSSLALLSDCQRNAREARLKLEPCKRPSRETGKAFCAYGCYGSLRKLEGHVRITRRQGCRLNGHWRPQERN